MARHSSFNSLFFIVKLLIIFQCGHSFVLVKAPTRLGQLEIWMGSRNALRQQLVFFFQKSLNESVSKNWAMEKREKNLIKLVEIPSALND